MRVTIYVASYNLISKEERVWSFSGYARLGFDMGS